MANCIKCGADNPTGVARCEYCGSIINLIKENPAVGTEAAREQVTVQESAPMPTPTAAPSFRRVSVGLIVLFALFSVGLYISIWFFVRRKEFASLSQKAKNATLVFGSLLAIHIFYVLGVFGYLGNPDNELLDALVIIWYAMIGVMIYSAFIARAALAEFSASRGMSFAGSIVWTVLLNALYLQSQINHMLDARVLNVAP